jgi:hypothetical protein
VIPRKALLVALTASAVLHLGAAAFLMPGSPLLSAPAGVERVAVRVIAVSIAHAPAQAPIIPAEAPTEADSAPADAIQPSIQVSAEAARLSSRPPAILDDETFLLTSEVDQPAVPLATWTVDAPRSVGDPPKVVVRVWITRRGDVAQLEFERSQLPPDTLSKIRAVIQTSRFEPAIRAGQRVGNVRVMEVVLEQPLESVASN